MVGLAQGMAGPAGAAGTRRLAVGEFAELEFDHTFHLGNDDGRGELAKGVRRMQAARSYRFGAGVALATPLLLFWVIGAVGLIGVEGDPFDRIYGGVVGVGLVGAVIARLRAAGMARAMFAAAGAQAVVIVIALIVGKQHVAVSSVPEIVLLNGFFVALWCGSAMLFRRAARERGLD